MRMQKLQEDMTKPIASFENLRVEFQTKPALLLGLKMFLLR